MRVVHNDARTLAASKPAAAGEATRRCILGGAAAGRSRMIRLVAGPDGCAWPDFGARLPGRGAWIAVDKATIEQAIANGRLQSALQRTLKCRIAVDADLAARIDAGLERRFLDRLGLESRAGQLVFGSDRIAEQARGGQLAMLLHAADAAADGSARLDQAWRAGRGDKDGIFCLPVGRQALSRALGRENVVHSGVIHAKAAARIRDDLVRWMNYIGENRQTGTGLEPIDRQNDEGRE